jgi:hypothetical protein
MSKVGITTLAIGEAVRGYQTFAIALVASLSSCIYHEKTLLPKEDSLNRYYHVTRPFLNLGYLYLVWGGGVVLFLQGCSNDIIVSVMPSSSTNRTALTLIAESNLPSPGSPCQKKPKCVCYKITLLLERSFHYFSFGSLIVPPSIIHSFHATHLDPKPFSQMMD